MVIENREDYVKIANPYTQPKSGNKYSAFLVSLLNNSNMMIDGGGCDYHHTFEALLEDGYVLQAENTASTVWKENRMVWCVDDIPPGETRRGCIVFTIPISKKIKHITFYVNEKTGPLQSISRGKIKVTP